MSSSAVVRWIANQPFAAHARLQPHQAYSDRGTYLQPRGDNPAPPPNARLVLYEYLRSIWLCHSAHKARRSISAGANLLARLTPYLDIAAYTPVQPHHDQWHDALALMTRRRRRFYQTQQIAPASLHLILKPSGVSQITSP